ncbi:hypothetical protein BOX15_Mlig023440g2, partial [Macrostomum lignano]
SSSDSSAAPTVASSSSTADCATSGSVEVRRKLRRSLHQSDAAEPSEPDSADKEDCTPSCTKRSRQQLTVQTDRCAICLCDPVDPSYTWSCLHRYCFGCLLEWAKRKPECPQCKCTFTTIIHNVRSDSDYDEYPVPLPLPPAPPPVWTLGNNPNNAPLFTSRAGPFHLYRPFLDREDLAELESPRRAQPQQQQQQQPDISRPNRFPGLQAAELPVWQSVSIQQQQQNMFEFSPQQRQFRLSQDELTASRDAALPYEEEREIGDSDQPLPCPLTSSNRHLLYLRGFRPVPDPQAVQVTAARFETNEAERHRLVPFLLRELRTLTRYDSFSMQRIVHHLLRLVGYHELDSAVFHRLAKAYLGRHGRLFCVHLAHFSGAVDCQPTLAQYDAAVKYVRVDDGDIKEHNQLEDNDPLLSVELKRVARNVRPGPTPLETDAESPLSPGERDFTALTPRQRPMILTRLAAASERQVSAGLNATDTTGSGSSSNSSSSGVINYMQLLHSVSWQFSNDLFDAREQNRDQQQQQHRRRPSSPWPPNGVDYSTTSTSGRQSTNATNTTDNNSGDFNFLGAALLAPFEAVVAAAAAAAVAVSSSSSSAASPPLPDANDSRPSPLSTSAAGASSASDASSSQQRRSNILNTPKRRSPVRDPIAATPLLSHLLNATPTAPTANAAAARGEVRIASLASASSSSQSVSSATTTTRTTTTRWRPLFDDLNVVSGEDLPRDGSDWLPSRRRLLRRRRRENGASEMPAPAASSPSQASVPAVQQDGDVGED